MKKDNTIYFLIAAAAIAAFYLYSKNKPTTASTVVSNEGKATVNKSFMNLPINPSNFKAKFALGKIPNTI